MRSLKIVLVAVALTVGVSASADCCCQPTKCVKTITKCVPYKSCKVVCEPVYDACGNIVCYKSVKKCTTKYKKVTVKQTFCCCK